MNRLEVASVAAFGAIALVAATGCRQASDADATAKMDHSAAGSGAVAAGGGDGSHDHLATDEGEGKELYQCSMHPNVVSEKPGTCPICGMDLQPVKQIDAQGIPGRAPVELSGLQKQLINIRTVPVAEVPFEQTLRAVGRVVVNERNTATLNSRVTGWVEQLHVDTTGATVEKGQPLMDVYSPALYSAQQDFLIVHRRARDDTSSGSLLESARKRLELWGISEEQIRQLERTGESTQTLTLAAPRAGTVIEKTVVAAQMVEPGMPLYRIADLSEVWVLAELYESELPSVDVGEKAIVTSSGYPGRSWEGRVDFIYPFLQGKTRTNQMRVVLANPEGLLKPDMYVDVELARDLGSPLSVPASAVFNTGKQQYVFVEQSDGVFVPTLVELGPQVGGRQAIRSGVQAGDAVVVDGNFLLDSESQLKAVASGTTEEPAAATGEDMPESVPLPPSAKTLYAPLVDSYLELHDHLANDRLEGVTASAARLREQLNVIANSDAAPSDQAEIYEERIQTLLRSAESFTPSDLDEARIGFGQLSFELIALLTQFPPPLAQPLRVFNCPMWEQSPGRWIQAAEQIRNPFMGQSMPACGEAVSTISSNP